MNYQDTLIDNPNYNGITLKKLFESSMEDLPFMQMQTKGPKEKGTESPSDWENGSAAYLGPQLWEKTIPCNSDLKFECMDLDEFLNENELEDEFFRKNQLFTGQNPKISQTQDLDRLSPSIGTSDFATPLVTEADLDNQDRQSPLLKSSPKPAMSPERNVRSPGSCSSEYENSEEEGPDFDPRKRPFSEEELKPQPMMKKSRKQYVPNDLKDDKYWARRRKNNLAAKRSRDARRVKENQIVLRANFLEKENDTLKEELEKTMKMLEVMKKKLAAYEGSQS